MMLGPPGSSGYLTYAATLEIVGRRPKRPGVSSEKRFIQTVQLNSASRHPFFFMTLSTSHWVTSPTLDDQFHLKVGILGQTWKLSIVNDPLGSMDVWQLPYIG